MRTKADQIALERWMTTLGKDRVKIIENIQRKGKMESLSNHGEVLTAHGTATLSHIYEQLVRRLNKVRQVKHLPCLLHSLSYHLNN